jgi:hypothetical protein
VFKVTAKLGTMRKAVEWTVYPRNADAAATDRVLMQSDHRIAEFDPTTGAGRLSAHKSGGAYFFHLGFGATRITVPPEVIAAALAVAPKSGDEIGPGVYVA